jgi:hypothetical protein
MSKPSLLCINCGDPASLICPECKKLGLLSSSSAFCGNVCFKKSWKSHKQLHNQIKVTQCPYDINGTVITEEEGLGRVLKANKDFAIGDIVLQEKPLVRYKNKLINDMIKRYIRMSSEEKTKFLDMKHLLKPEDSKFQKFKERAMLMWKDAENCASYYGPSVTALDCFRIMSVYDHNAHAFIGTHEEKAEASESALFSIGSKAAHSCAPNCAYTSKVLDDHLIYFAVQPIASGENITFSYIGYMPTFQRREELKSTKDFLCECSKCDGIDYSNAHLCGKGGCKGIKLGNYHNSDSSIETWCCESCNDTGISDPIIFDDIQRRFIMIKNSYTRGGGRILPQHAKMMDDLAAETILKLSPTHYLVTEMYSEVSTLHASAAAILGLEPAYRQLSLDKSAEAIFKVIKTIECSDAQCIKGINCKTQHPPSSYAINHVLWACMDLRNSTVPLPSFVSLYISLLNCTYGPEDEDVLAIISKLKKSSKATVNAKS